MNKVPKYKMAIIIWLAIYPSINVLFLLIGDKLNALPLLLRTLIITGILIPLMVFILLPLLTKIFAKWLSKP
jgi:hypothetical protein